VWLKIFTSAMLLITVILMVGRPILVGPLPHRPAKRSELLVYSERALAFTGMLIVSLSSAGVGSIVLVRRANAEYRRLSMENMQVMLEGAIEDHKKKIEDTNESAS